MKKNICSLLLIFSFLALSRPGMVSGDPMEDLLESFKRDYVAAEPPDSTSSIKTDYRITQAALGTLYTTEGLALLYRQNEELLAKYDEMLMKYEQVVQQNKEMVRLLGLLAGKGDKEKEKPSTIGGGVPRTE
jgi:hypothetical protein